LFALLLVMAPALHAQVGATTDIITGTVVGPDGKPLVGATVEVTSLETEITRRKTTNDQGKYTLLFPDGGGQYRITVRHIGMLPVTFAVAKQADEDRLVADAKLTTGVATLATVNTTASRLNLDRPDRPTAGSIEKQLSGAELLRLPIDPSDINAIAALAPGVVGIAGSDSTAAGFSVAGQRPDQNQITLDGLSFDGAGVPAEAVRNTRVITNTYDVSRGQFTGGQVATTTKGGTNVLSGSFGYGIHDPALEFTAAADTADASAFSGAYTRNQLSGGVGGAIVKDKAFWFASLQVNRQTSALQSLLTADALTLQRLGVQPDSAARFLGLLNGYQVPLTLDGIPDDRLTDNGTGVARFDYHINEDHSLTARINWSGSRADNFRSDALGIPPLGGNRSTSGGGLLLSLSSTLFDQFINEVRGFYSRSTQSANPYSNGPEGRVRVSSILTSGVLGVSSLNFGGNPQLPSSSTSDQLEVTDEVSWIRGGGHRWKLGLLLNVSDISQLSSSNRDGTFTFNSLADFEANQPAQYTRIFSPNARSTSALNAAVYLGDSWRKSAAWQFVYGARLEGSQYRGAPASNPQVATLFGLSTSDFPSEVHVSPRMGFTWIIGAQNRVNGVDQPAAPAAGRGGFGGRGGGNGQRGGGAAAAATAVPGGVNSFGVLRGGFGEFRGRAPSSLFSSAVDATGLPTGETQLVCVGSAVPIPDWSLYQSDPSSLPSECADGTGPGQAFSNTRSNVTVFDPTFTAPRAWRGSLGFQKRFGLRFSASVDASYALGTHLYGVTDLNLNPTPQFTLAAEGRRPVFVPASSIVPTSGAVSVLGSRRVADFAHVYDINSQLESRTAQVTATVNGVSLTNLIWSLSYTHQNARDQSSFSGGSPAGGFSSPTTAGDPNLFEWSRSNLGREHNIQGTMTWMVKPWLDLTSVLGFSSGAPYTPLVGGDINGDGARNDRAFVFSPTSAPDTALGNGMQRLLAGAPAKARDCLLAQMNQIASRNTCVGDWTPRLDFQANVRPDLGGILQQRLQLQIQLVNPLTGLDQVLHGANNLRGWGQTSRVDPNLLFVRGFDSESQRFLYQVNERFGNNPATRSAVFNPFQVALTGRLQVGPDMQRDRTQAALRAIAGRGGAARAVDVKTIVNRVAPNPSATLMLLADSLHIALTMPQIDSISAIGRTLEAKDSLIIAEMQTRVDSTGGDVRTQFPQLQPALQLARDNYVAAVKTLQAILTPEQWAMLPEWFRNPTTQPNAGRRPGNGAAPGARPPASP
ncbi:MAG: carboxypeptidase regulatory-like domain-containing protein, partial [bacterium]